MSEEDDWKMFKNTNLKSKELLTKRMPKMAKNLDK